MGIGGVFVGLPVLSRESTTVLLKTSNNKKMAFKTYHPTSIINHRQESERQRTQALTSPGERAEDTHI